MSKVTEYTLKFKEIEKFVKEKKFHNLSPKLDSRQQMNVRRKILEKLTKIKLDNISNPSFDIKSVSERNCENLIGKIEIPLGIAGPLKVRGDYAKGDFFVPLASTEGALIASVNRGCKAITKSGGAYVYIEQNGMTRAPVFRTRNLKESRKFVVWVKSHISDIKRLIEKTDPHLKFLSVNPYIVGRNVFFRFVLDPEDAMGMNMVTIACDHVIKNYIEEKTGVRCVALSGNVCTDKKAAWINKIDRRGLSVHADVLIKEREVKRLLKSKASSILEVYLRKVLVGSSVAGSIGFNAHHANIIAAFFAATGQDLAHVVDASIGTTSVELLGKDLYFSVSLPDLPVGTLGGGTSLSTQKESLSILGVAGGGIPPGSNAKKLAEIIAATVLAGEISLLSALASGDLARAHKRLGRGEKI